MVGNPAARVGPNRDGDDAHGRSERGIHAQGAPLARRLSVAQDHHDAGPIASGLEGLDGLAHTGCEIRPRRFDQRRVESAHEFDEHVAIGCERREQHAAIAKGG